MPATSCPTAAPLFRGLFPDWTGSRPARFFFAEELLEARHRSHFPTNGAGPDEDVNVYLFGLLTGFLAGRTDPRVTVGAGGLHHPPSRDLPRGSRADWYRVNGDHRLLFLGLMDRGDGLRRRKVPFGFSAAESRSRDLEAARNCYAVAADLWEGRSGAPAGLVAVLRKLAANLEDYVHVLGVLAVRRLGLGARLSENDLQELFREAV
jgi:hypothetical protein